jgi:hypothetical protein
VHTTHELKQDTLLDDFMTYIDRGLILSSRGEFVGRANAVLTINGRRNTRYETLIDVIGIDHVLEFVDLLLCERVQEAILIFFSVLKITSRPACTLFDRMTRIVPSMLPRRLYI